MKNITQAIVIALLAISVGPAFGKGVSCSFTTECFDAEGCDAAGFDLQLVPGGDPDILMMESVAETVQGDVITFTESGTSVWRAVTASSVQILSWNDASARYTLHLTDGPMMVSYVGTCESAE